MAPTPAQLRYLPQVNSLLIELGYGDLVFESIHGFPGRHVNWAGRTVSGQEVFVKRVDDGSTDSRMRLQRLISAVVPHGRSNKPPVTPRRLGWRETDQLIVFELLNPARNGAQLAEDGEFDEDLAAQCGRLLADLHNTAVAPGELDSSHPRFPPIVELDALPLTTFVAASGAELELWRLAQDTPLRRMLIELNRLSQSASLTPAHCDLRLDQFIVSDGRVYLCDWDELRLDDPAADIGTFVGEWLFRTNLKLADPRPAPNVAELTDEQLINHGSGEFALVRPLITAFWTAYRTERPAADAGLAARAVGYAGWHQFDRVLAAAHERTTLRPTERAAASIGRTALTDPAAFVSALGLGDCS